MVIIFRGFFDRNFCGLEKKLLYDGVMSYVVMNLRVVFELVIVMFFIKIKKKKLY